MSTSHPPRLQLNLPPPTQSFKRSFQEFGFDVDSPGATSGSSSSADTSGSSTGTNNDRNKRARSETLGGATGSGDSSGSSFVPSLDSIESSDVPADPQERSPPTSSLSIAIQSGFLEPSELSRFSPRLASLLRTDDNDVRMIDSPYNVSPHLAPQPMQEEWEPSLDFPPMQPTEDAIRGSLERVRELNSLRQRASNVLSRTSTSRPRLPPLASFEDLTVDLSSLRDDSTSDDLWNSDPIWSTTIDSLRSPRNRFVDDNDLPSWTRIENLHEVLRPVNANGEDGTSISRPSRSGLSRIPPRVPSPVIPDLLDLYPGPPPPHSPRANSPRPETYAIPSPDSFTLRPPNDFPRPFATPEEERTSLLEHVNALLENFSESPSLELSTGLAARNADRDAGQDRGRERPPLPTSILSMMIRSQAQGSSARRRETSPHVQRWPQLLGPRAPTRSPSPQLPASVLEDSWQTRRRRLSDDLSGRHSSRIETSSRLSSRPHSTLAANEAASFNSSLVSLYMRQRGYEGGSDDVDRNTGDSDRLQPAPRFSAEYVPARRLERPRRENRTSVNDTASTDIADYIRSLDSPLPRVPNDVNARGSSSSGMWDPYSTFAPRRTEQVLPRFSSFSRAHSSVPSASASLMAESTAERHRSSDRARLLSSLAGRSLDADDMQLVYPDAQQDMDIMEDEQPIRPRLRTLRQPFVPPRPQAGQSGSSSANTLRHSSILSRLNRTAVDTSSSSEDAAFYASGISPNTQAEPTPTLRLGRQTGSPSVSSLPTPAARERPSFGRAVGSDDYMVPWIELPADLIRSRSPLSEETRPVPNDAPLQGPTSSMPQDIPGPARQLRTSLGSSPRYPDFRLPPRSQGARPWSGVFSRGHNNTQNELRPSQAPSLPPLPFQRESMSLNDDSLDHFDIHDDMRSRPPTLPGIGRLLPRRGPPAGTYNSEADIRHEREAMHEALTNRRWRTPGVPSRVPEGEPELPVPRGSSGFEEAMNVLRADGLSAARQQQFQSAFQADRRGRNRGVHWGDIEGDDGIAVPRGGAGISIEALRRRELSRAAQEGPRAGFPGVRGLSMTRRPPSPPPAPSTGSPTRPGIGSSIPSARRFARARRLRTSTLFTEEMFADPTWAHLPYSQTFRNRRPGGRNLGDYVRDEDFDSSYESLLALAATLGDAKPRATPEHIIGSLPAGAYKDWQTQDCETRCPICLDDYQPVDPVLKIPSCNHWFHKECLEQWLHSARTCPVCRRRVKATPPPAERGPAEAGPSGTHHENHLSDESDSDSLNFGDFV